MATYIRSVDGKVQVEIEPGSPATLLPNIGTQGIQKEIDDLEQAITTYRGQPVVVENAADMDDELTIYLYMGSESGYNANHWYYYDGTEWVDGGEYVSNPVLIDDTLTQSGEAADAKVTGDEISALKADLSQVGHPPDLKNSTAEGVDLDISDPQGNVILRLADGHVKTKKFDSSSIDSNTAVDNVSVSGTEDLDITDNNGNAIVQFTSGHIKTKNFDSASPVHRERLDYYAEIEYSGATDIEINQSFRTGDTLIFHTSISDNNITDAIGAYVINYYGITSGGVSILLRSDYGWNFPKVTINQDFVKLKASLPNGLTWGETKDVKFIVYHTFGEDIKRTEISVSPDGSRDYTTLKDALTSMTDNNALTQYIVKVYPGTYNVLSDFTDNEILDENFKGLIVMNGVYVEGVGQRDDIVINGVLEGSTYDSVRNNISPFNMAGDSGLSNMTIIATGMRYCIHDDIGSSASRTHIFKHLTLRASSMTSASAYNITYGAGYGNMKNMLFEDVDFGDAMSTHGTEGWTYSPRIVLENCSAKLYTFGDYASDENVYITMNNCKGVAIRVTRSSESQTQYIRLNGEGTNDIIMDCYEGFVYNLGQCRKYENAYNFSVGQAVKLGTAYGLIATSNRDEMFGIVLGKLDGDTYVQIGGYVDANTFGISGLSVGDYVHLDSNGILASGGNASDAVGIVISTSLFEGGASIKMLGGM